MPGYDPGRFRRNAIFARHKLPDPGIGQTALGRLPHCDIAAVGRCSHDRFPLRARHGMDPYVHARQYTTAAFDTCSREA